MQMRTSRTIRNWAALVLLIVVLGTAKSAYAYSQYCQASGIADESTCQSGAESLCRSVCSIHMQPYYTTYCMEDPIQHTWQRWCQCGLPDD